MKINIFLLLFFALVIGSCKKQHLPLPTATFIEIGNATGMENTSINSSMYPPYSPFLREINYDIDVNKDGENDIRFYIGYSNSAGGGEHGNQTISVLHNKIFLMGGPYNDSIFIKQDTSIINLGLGVVNVNIKKTHYFSRTGTFDSLAFINHYNFKPYSLVAGETLKLTDNFGKAETTLLDDNPFQADSTKNGYTTHDTTYSFLINKKINENPYPMFKDLYFGFKFNDGTISRLGWIKFRITGKGELYLFESAIQKN